MCYIAHVKMLAVQQCFHITDALGLFAVLNDRLCNADIFLSAIQFLNDQTDKYE